ncbi:unnamed protein product [Caenorhabditis nigoni]
MIALEQWKSFLKVTQLTAGSFGIILNVVLILLIMFRSPKHLGAYKYLMLYISFVELVYSVLEIIIEPHIFTYGPTLTVFRYFKHSRIGRTQGFYLIVVYGGTFGQALALFGVHFVYRWLLEENEESRRRECWEPESESNDLKITELTERIFKAFCSYTCHVASS